MNSETEKQVKFFQGCIATAFAERDHALMESEKAKEHEEAILLEFNATKDRIEEVESTCAELWRDNAGLQAELLTIKEKIVPFGKVVAKFYGIRETAIGHACDSWDEKCACLLDDPDEIWSFDEDRNSSTSLYIASLEEKLAATKFSAENLQSKIRMGMEIEHHLNRKARTLETKLVDLCNIASEGIVKLRTFHIQIRAEIMSMLQFEKDDLESILAKFENGPHFASQPYMMVTESEKWSSEEIPGDRILGTEHGAFQEGKEHENLHIQCNDKSTTIARTSVSGRPAISSNDLDSSDALSLALQEKVDALLLLSQQEERHLLEKDLNAALHLKIGELKSSLLQVTREKVEALLELADLKQKIQQQQQQQDDSSPMRDGRFKDLLKKAYLIRWRGKLVTGNEVLRPSIPKVNVTDEEKPLPDTARSTMEASVLQDSITNLEDLTSSMRKLHMSISKMRDEVSPSMNTSVVGLLDDVILEADRIKAALGSSLPLSSSSTGTGDSDVFISEDRLNQASAVLLNEKPKALPIAMVEMAELLTLLAILLKENAISRTTDASGT